MKKIFASMLCLGLAGAVILSACGKKAVKKENEEVVVEKRVPVENGAVNIHLSSTDTDIQAKTYYWDLRIMMPIGDGSYTVVTPMEYAAFTTLEAIGNV